MGACAEKGGGRAHWCGGGGPHASAKSNARLQLPLHKVRQPQHHRERLHKPAPGVAALGRLQPRARQPRLQAQGLPRAPKQRRGAQQGKQHDGDGPRVLHIENGAVGHLGAQVLDKHLPRRIQPQLPQRAQLARKLLHGRRVLGLRGAARRVRGGAQLDAGGVQARGGAHGGLERGEGIRGGGGNGEGLALIDGVDRMRHGWRYTNVYSATGTGQASGGSGGLLSAVSS